MAKKFSYQYILLYWYTTKWAIYNYKYNLSVTPIKDIALGGPYPFYLPTPDHLIFFTTLICLPKNSESLYKFIIFAYPWRIPALYLPTPEEFRPYICLPVKDSKVN